MKRMGGDISEKQNQRHQPLHRRPDLLANITAHDIQMCQRYYPRKKYMTFLEEGALIEENIAGFILAYSYVSNYSG